MDGLQINEYNTGIVDMLLIVNGTRYCFKSYILFEYTVSYNMCLPPVSLIILERLSILQSFF